MTNPGDAVAARLANLLRAVACGNPPVPDGAVEVLPRPAGARAAIVAFTAHHLVAADVDSAWVDARCPAWALEAPFGAPFVIALADRLGARAGSLDVVLVAGATARSETALIRVTGADAVAAVAGAPNPRRDVTVWRTPDGLGELVLGRGLADRWEIAVSVRSEAQGRGIGRALLSAARGLVEPGDFITAQIAPGNVASLRAALAAGFRPVAAEILFFA